MSGTDLPLEDQHDLQHYNIRLNYRAAKLMNQELIVRNLHSLSGLWYVC